MRGSGLQLSEGKPRGVGATIRGLEPGGIPGAGLLRYFDKKRSAPVTGSFQPRLTGLPGAQVRNGKLYTGSELFKCRQTKGGMYSLSGATEGYDSRVNNGHQKSHAWTTTVGLQLSKVVQPKHGRFQKVLTDADISNREGTNGTDSRGT